MDFAYSHGIHFDRNSPFLSYAWELFIGKSRFSGIKQLFERNFFHSASKLCPDLFVCLFYVNRIWRKCWDKETWYSTQVKLVLKFWAAHKAFSNSSNWPQLRQPLSSLGRQLCQGKQQLLPIREEWGRPTLKLQLPHLAVAWVPSQVWPMTHFYQQQCNFT